MPNKYSILPAEIRYNPNFNFGEKVMYAEITACADENGVCTATNEHFSHAFDKSTKWVSNSLTSLKQNGCIDVSISKSKGNYREIRILPLERIITVSVENDNVYAFEVPHGNATSLQSNQSNFERLWSIYPNQSERERAEIAFLELSPNADLLDKIITDVEIRKTSDEWLSGNIPYLCNYLAKRKWER